MQAKWVIRGDHLCLSIAYQQPSETSSGTTGTSTNWQVPIVTLAETANYIIDDVKKSFNWQGVKGLDDWTKLL